MKVSIIGTGYLGAVHAACMARIGHDVAAFDTDASKIAKLSAGASPLFGPGLDVLLTAEVGSGRLQFTQSPEEAVSGASVHFVCVGTPQLPDSDATDVRFVNNAVDMIAAHAAGDGLIVGSRPFRLGRLGGWGPNWRRGLFRIAWRWRGTLNFCGRARRSRTPCISSNLDPVALGSTVRTPTMLDTATRSTRSSGRALAGGPTARAAVIAMFEGVGLD